MRVEQRQVRELRQLADVRQSVVGDRGGALQVERLELRERRELRQPGVGDERVLQLQLGEIRERHDVVDAGVRDSGAPQRKLLQIRATAASSFEIVVRRRPIEQVDADDLAGFGQLDAPGELFDAVAKGGLIGGRRRRSRRECQQDDTEPAEDETRA